MITGEEEPDSGTLKMGSSVQPAYVEQNREALEGDKTVFEAVSEGKETVNLGGREINARAYIAKFNIAGPEQQKKVSELSGGIRNRVHLAMMVKQGANLLLLDEPTNDLDVNTMRSLEEALLNFAGSALIISHDRWFLDRVATHILAFEGNSQVMWFNGNFSEYMQDKRKRLGKNADIPQRIKYRKLTRG
jgi:ATPase subunit of ABC transporter with duplicated ATPase domains